MSLDSLEYLEEDRINGCNLYAYCGNDPINMSDPSGTIAVTLSVIFWSFVIGAVVGAASQVVTDVVVNVNENKLDFEKWEFSSWESYVGSAVGGGIGGVVSLFAGPAISGAVDGFISSFTSMCLENITRKSNYSAEEVLFSSILVGGISFLFACCFDDPLSKPDDLVQNFLDYSSKSLKTKGTILVQSIINSIPNSIINSITSGGGEGALLSPAY